MKQLWIVTFAVSIHAVDGWTQTTPLKTECMSDVCLGDDLAKLTNLKITWLDENAPRSQPTTPRRFSTGYEPQMNPQNLKEVEKDFRGLTDWEYKALATTVGTGGVADNDMRQFVPQTTLHIKLLDTTLPILKKTVACSAIPLVGFFKSENGYLTMVLLMSDNGKLKVVQLARQWALNAPSNANSAQARQMFNEQLQALYKQVRETYGGAWVMDRYFVPPVSASARSDDAVAYFSWRDGGGGGSSGVPHPRLTLYTAAFAKFQSQNVDSSPIEWSNVIATYERALAGNPGCAVKAPAIKIN